MKEDAESLAKAFRAFHAQPLATPERSAMDEKTEAYRQMLKELGDHVAQAGSYVCKDYARFDFSHFEKVSDDQLREIEKIVNTFIANQYPISK